MTNGGRRGLSDQPPADVGAAEAGASDATSAWDVDRVEAEARVDLQLLELRAGTGELGLDTIAARRRALEATLARCGEERARQRTRRPASAPGPASANESAAAARSISTLGATTHAPTVAPALPKTESPPPATASVAGAGRWRWYAWAAGALLVVAWVAARPSPGLTPSGSAPPSGEAAPVAATPAPPVGPLPPTTGVGPSSNGEKTAAPGIAARPRREPVGAAARPATVSSASVPGGARPRAAASTTSAPAAGVATAPDTAPAQPADRGDSETAAPPAPPAPRLPMPVEDAGAPARSAAASSRATAGAEVAEASAAVRQVMGAYWRAFRDLDDAGVSRVFPGARTDVIRRSFQALQSQHIDVLEETVGIDGDRAVVTTAVRHSFVPKTGKGGAESYAARFELRRQNGTWTIVARE